MYRSPEPILSLGNGSGLWRDGWLANYGLNCTLCLRTVRNSPNRYKHFLKSTLPKLYTYCIRALLKLISTVEMIFRTYNYFYQCDMGAVRIGRIYI